MAANKYVALVTGKLKEIVASVTGTANAIPAGDATGRLDISWMPVGVGQEVVTATASEALTAGDFVNLYSNAGTINARKSDATTNAKPAHGFVTANVLLNGSATVFILGVNNSSVAALTVGSLYFISTTPGGITATAPSAVGNIVQQIGVATTATNILTFNTAGGYIEVA